MALFYSNNFYIKILPHVLTEEAFSCIIKLTRSELI